MYTKEEREGILWEFHRSGLSAAAACRALRLFPTRSNLCRWLRLEESGELVAREMPDRASRMHCAHDEGSPAYAARERRRGRIAASDGAGEGRGMGEEGQTDWRDWGRDLPEDPAERARMAEVKLAEALAVLDVLKAPGPGSLTNREKVVRAIMAEEGLVARKAAEAARRARYNSYRGELAERPANLPLREDGTHDFSAPEPGLLALTDVTEFSLDGFKAYLSPAIDCFDGWPVCWRLSRHPDKGLVVGMLRDLVAAVRPTADRPLVLHSDGGAVYMTGEWAEACREGHVTRSMSRKARSPDNARCEGFFGTLKSDFFDGRDWTGVTFEGFSERLNEYIEWYRSGKLKKSLGWKTIGQHRAELGYAV